MKKILLISTGGTIASVKTDFGLSPKVDPKEFLNFVPEIKNLADVDVVQVLNIDSTNIEPYHWIKIVTVIEENYKNYDGFIITHGTDTLAYSGCAISYLIQGLDKPIILTGAQKPISDAITDAKKNLVDSVRFAISGVKGVYIVFDGRAIIGTRAKKFRSKSYQAFESINYPIAAFIDGKRVLKYVDENQSERKLKIFKSLDNKVFLLKLIPGIDPSILKYIGSKYDAIVIESYGVGGVPFNEEQDFKSILRELTESGKIIVIATQVMLEGSDAITYEVGYDIIKNYNVLEAYDMTVEAAVTKLMWILAQTKDFKKVKEMFYKEVNKDILVENI